MVEWYEAYADYPTGARRALEAVVRGRGRGGRVRRRARLLARRGGASASSTRSRRRRASTCTARAPPRRWPRAIGARASTLQDRRAHLGAARRRPALELRRADAHPADVRVRLPGRALAVRPRAPLASRGSSSAGRPSPAGWRSPTPSPSSTTPTSSARASPRSSAGAAPAATPRRSPTTRPSSRRSSRACRRPAGVGLGIDRLVMLLTGQRLDPRGRAVPGDARSRAACSALCSGIRAPGSRDGSARTDVGDRRVGW